MGTLSPRGQHSEVASTTTDDEYKADWPAGGQRPRIPQEEGANEERANDERANEETANEETANEETANEEAANEEEGAAIENGGATSEEKGGGNGLVPATGNAPKRNVDTSHFLKETEVFFAKCLPVDFGL
ncbi:hypothetical protein NDU88_001992 [Pleurodeles waltl]|uniref:Uncharacterized protein n=1 Tax=Pleurodeles waltl TaxID=8319 RepID=A0AAV7W375_PLEWA|nr:hypothetical protein NDU88_001992 [Pleurodeles waltl]